MASYHFSVKSGKKGKATDHATYIAREGKHEKNDKETDLVFKEHGNLPEWANDNPMIFWNAADKNERANGSVYREFEIALPSELTDKQNIELVKDLVKNQVGDKPYLLAVHAPDASLGNGKQPHLHLMFSDRKPDGINRSPDLHFKRFNRISPENGGCKKDSGGKDRYILREELISCRESVAHIENAHLEKHGHAARVDHRSNKERGIKQDPERHLGQSGVKKLTDEDKAALQTERTVKGTALAKDIQATQTEGPVSAEGTASQD